MPKYPFECLKERDGCGATKEITCTFAEHDKLRKDPPKCGKCGKPMEQQLVPFGQPGWSVSQGIQT